ncbi:MAG: 6-phosphofructokinase [Chloroflexia bacterium]
MRVGVLTGGGDCPGLNPAIRAVVRRALQHGFEVLGIRNGWAGLLGDGDVVPLDLQFVSGILHVGGTKLGTSRTNPAKDEAMMSQVQRNLERYGIEALVAIGGDDTLGVAHRLSQRGFHVVGIPKTMDNDVVGTDYCIGFDSAVSIVAEALDRLHTTAESHHRVIVVEVMGRDTGWVAIMGGLAGGADFILIPEEPHTLEEVIASLERRRQRGKNFSIIVVAEGVVMPELADKEAICERDAFGHVRLDRRCVAETIAQMIGERTGMETRHVVLGHLQRGGSPTVFDRVLATRFGVRAADMVQAGRFGRMVAIQGNHIVEVPLEVAASGIKPVDPELIRLAQVFY